VGEAKDFSEALRMTCDLKPQIMLMDLRWSEEEDRTPRRVKSHPETAGSQLLAISVWNDEDTSSLANKFEVFTSFDKMKLSAALLLAIKKFASGRPQPVNLSRTEALEAREFFRFREDPGLLSSTASLPGRALDGIIESFARSLPRNVSRARP
jgi:hypothetical protein